MNQFPNHARRLTLLGLGLLAAGPLAAQTMLHNNGGTIFVNTGGQLQVNGAVQQTGAARLTTTGTATVSGGVTSAAASTLDLSTGTLDVAGDVAHAGPIAGTTGTLRLSGPANQSLNVAGGTVPNLTVDKPNGTVTLAQAVVIRRVLALDQDADLDTNGQALTLLSDASGTALLANLGTGKNQVRGDITVQRYIDPSLNPGLGYRHLSAPVLNLPVTGFAPSGSAPVLNPAYNTAAKPGTVTPFPTIFRYDQARLATSPATTLAAFDKGWLSPALTDPTSFGESGFTVQLPGAATLSFTGDTYQSGVGLSLNRASDATAAEAGWNFIGNPFASPLDFSTIAASQRTNVDAAFYTFESTSRYGGNYRSYVNGVGASPLIGSSQAFWVRVSAGQTTGNLLLSNANRVTSYAQQAPVRRGAADTRPQVQLTLAGAGVADHLFLYAQAGASAAFDGEFDAAKLANSSGLNLAALTAAGQQLAIDGRADFTAATSVPLFVGVPAAGSYTLSAARLANLAGTRAELIDNLTNTRTPLATGASYAFTTTTTTAPGRFWLNLSPAAAPLATSAAALAAQVLAYPNPSHGRFTVLRPAGTVAAAELLNALGQRVRTLTLPTAETVVDLTGLATGVYTLRLTLDGQPVIKRLMVE